MSQLRAPRPEAMPALYTRIRFEPALESRALRCLAEIDLEGCRASLGRLIDQMDFTAAGSPRRQSVLLLLSVLLQVSSRVHRLTTDGGRHHASRVALLERFAAYEDPEDARQAFIPALNRLLADVRPTSPGGLPQLVERAQSFVEENYAHRLSLSTVAAHLNVSRNYLSRLFHQETGSTLTAYIHRTRLEHARLLLASGGRSISEIAYLVGYQNYRDFYRNFVKYEKASPRQAQRRLAAGRTDAAGPAGQGDVG